MKTYTLSIGSTVLLSLILCAWFCNHDPVSCTVQHAGSSVDGFYVALNGVYIKKGFQLYHLPDIFSIARLHASVDDRQYMALTKSMWTIANRQTVQFYNEPSDTNQYFDQPPRSNWHSRSSGDSSTGAVELQVMGCTGSLQDSSFQYAGEQSNLQNLTNRPVTTAILLLILCIAYYLWAYSVDVAAVAYSYDLFAVQGEYWRSVTSSLAHFDLLHLGFNAMTLYQLGMLEPLYGSLAFAYLSVDLVFITMLLLTGLYHVLITRYGRTEMYTQLGVGYSCVLFAWIVVQSVRMRAYCPIFLLPTLCFDTWAVPLPFETLLELKVNVGPFVMLLFTKLIIPRSSFLGHLAGILIGYPLAWSLLNWMTPPVLVALLCAAALCREQLVPWRLAGYDVEDVVLADFVPLPQLRRQVGLQVLLCATFTLSALAVYAMGASQLLPRAVLCYLLWSAVQARRCEWLTESAAVQQSAALLLLMALSLQLVQFGCDATTLTAALTARNLILANGLQRGHYALSVAVVGLLVAVGAATLLLLHQAMTEIRPGNALLMKAGLDSLSVQQELRVTGAASVCKLCGMSNNAGAVVFTSTRHGRRLGAEEEQEDLLSRSSSPLRAGEVETVHI